MKIFFGFSICEQYARMLHRDSLAQQRMLKMTEVRDGLGLPLNPMKIYGTLRHLGPVFAYYPELLHRLVVLNSSGAMLSFKAFAQPFAKALFKNWFSDKFNETQFEQDNAKVQLIAIGDWEGVARCLPPATILAWAGTIPPRGPTVRAGLLVARAMALRAGAAATWRCEGDAALAALFFPGAGGRVQRLREGPGRGTFTAPADGVLFLAADNSRAWVGSAAAQLDLAAAS